MQTRREILTVLVASSAALAQSKPNFSGRWQVDPSRGTFAAPADLTEVIDHREAAISIDTTVNMSQGTGLALASLLAPRMRLTTNGAQDSNAMPMGLSLASQSHWQGDRLVTEWRISGMPNGAMTGSWARSLADGGRLMIVELTAIAGDRRVEAKLLFVRKD